MNSDRTTRFVGLIVAVMMTVAIHGAMLLTFDAVAQKGAVGSGSQTPTVVMLDAVKIVAHRS